MIGNTRLAGPDDEDLVLLYDHAARLAAEDAADKELGAVVQGAFSGRLGYIGCLLYGGLRRHHPNLTLAYAHKLVDQAVQQNNLLPLQESMLKALEASMPKPEPGTNPPKAPENGTGMPSSEPGVRKASTRTRSGGKPRARSR